MMFQSIRLSLAIWLWKWLMHPEFPVTNIYAPGCAADDDVPVKAWIVADSEETLDLILSGKSLEDDE